MINRVERVNDLVKIKHALISVADKTNLERLVPRLLEINRELRIYSTGGTYGRIKELLGDVAAGRLVRVAEYTGQPEMQGGLVKTLDFKIYLGLLSEPFNPDHDRDLVRTGAVAFDLVVVNLYPFRQVTSEAGVTCEQARAHIDIGGPAMLRAAAKNFLRVASVCDPNDYEEILKGLSRQGGATTLRERYRLAQKAFRHTAGYDAAIAEYLSKLGPDEAADSYEMVKR